jgi:hypothetical protein
MTVPVINAYINFSTGASFAQAMILDQGLLDTNILADSLALIVDVSNVVDSVTTKRGRSATADEFQTGTMTLRIVDQLGNFNPQNASSPYYTYLTPMKKVLISATYAGVTYPLFSGFITSYTTNTPKNVGELVYTTITAVDASQLARNAQIAAVTGATAGDLSGTRINQILNTISWPSSMRDVDAGLQTMQNDPGTARTALAALQTVANSEYGAVYVDASGSWAFQDRTVTTASVAGTATVFNDDGTAIGYNNAVWLLDNTLIFNQANITRTGGSVQSASNAASVAKYFATTYNQQDLLMQTDADALNYALAYVASRAETSVRCDAIELDLYTANYTAGTIAALNLDFFDPVSITTNQPGGSTLSKTLQVFGVAHTVTPNKWRTTFTTLEPIIDGFILNSTLYGVLDTSVLSY